MLTYIISLFVFLALLVVGSEVILRRLGARPRRQKTQKSIRYEPDGRFFTGHPIFGWTHFPGKFRVWLSDTFSFVCTHKENALRVSRPQSEVVDTDGAANKPQIWVFGCSYTHGWSLNDEETYVWQLQSRMPEYQIDNYGRDGYSTLQSLLLFKESLKVLPPPAVVVLAYGGFHDRRNTFSRGWKKRLAGTNKLGKISVPMARVDREGALRISYTPLKYRPVPFGSLLAVSATLENLVDRFLERNIDRKKVTLTIIREFQRICSDKNIAFVVAGITNSSGTEHTLSLCEKESISTVDISVDVSSNRPEYNNLPVDVHPSALANTRYADKLEVFLKPNLRQGRHPSVQTSQVR